MLLHGPLNRHCWSSANSSGTSPREQRICSIHRQQRRKTRVPSEWNGAGMREEQRGQLDRGTDFLMG